MFRAQGVGELVGPVLGWSSALASFGAFVVPSILGVAIAENKVAVNMFGFAGYYLFCFLLNFWFYLRPGKGEKCLSFLFVYFSLLACFLLVYASLLACLCVSVCLFVYASLLACRGVHDLSFYVYIHTNIYTYIQEG